MKVFVWTVVAAVAAAVLMAFSLDSDARSSSVVRDFRKDNPCPSTGKTTGACPGWVVDHMIPLCAGGPDVPDNMMWQEKKQSYRKDVYERQLCANIKKFCPKPTEEQS